MKKTTALIFALVLIFALPACTKTAGERASKALNNAQNPSEKTVVIATHNETAETTAPQNETTPATEAPVTPSATAPAKAKETETTPQNEPEAPATTPPPTSAQSNNNVVITRERAIEIALEKAGLARSSVYELEAERDKERNGTFWEVEFETRENEYSYHINALTGEVVISKVTPENKTPKNTTPHTEPATEKATEATTAPKAEAELITRERAVEIALEKAGLTRSSVYELEAERDKERNGTFWEVDFETREYEYSYEINAETGTVTCQEKERND